MTSPNNGAPPIGVIDPGTPRANVTNSSSHQPPAFLSSTIIPLPPKTIGGIRDQMLKIKKCSCKRSGCLKLYCDCFNSGIYCNDSCRCNNCRNIEFKGPTIGPDGKAISSAPPTVAPSTDKTPTTNTTGTKKRKRWKDIKDIDPNTDPRIEMIQIVLDRNQHAFRPKAINITASQRGDEARGTITTSLTNRPLMTGESRAKKTKLGCNCRKSFCLKKYCDCFQAQLYCMSTCRCKDCQNKVGNEKREKLIAKLKKKEGEKKSQKLASFATSSCSAKKDSTGGGAGGVRKNNVLSDMPTTMSIGGVPAKTVAMITAGVTAAGVDVFLPASNYAKPMILKGVNGEEDRTLDEIAFGMVGRQKVGGPTGPCDNDTKPNISPDTAVDDGKGGDDENDGSAIAQNKHDSQTQQMSVMEEMNARFKSFKAVLERMEAGTTHDRQDNILVGTSKVVSNSKSTNEIENKTKSESGVAQAQNMSELSERTCIQAKSPEYDRHKDAETIIANVIKDLTVIKKKMEAADSNARQKVDELIMNKKRRRQDADADAEADAKNTQETDNKMTENQEGSSTMTKKDEDNDGADETLPNDKMKELYSRAAQDVALYRELALIFRQRALELANIRKRNANVHSNLSS